MHPSLSAPFPWFGGKRRIAPLIWQRFGTCRTYIEPFAGSLATLLARPSPQGNEIVNDLDCYVANFWRALQRDPEAVAWLADYPVNEAWNRKTDDEQENTRHRQGSFPPECLRSGSRMELRRRWK